MWLMPCNISQMKPQNVNNGNRAGPGMCIHRQFGARAKQAHNTCLPFFCCACRKQHKAWPATFIDEWRPINYSSSPCDCGDKKCKREVYKWIGVRFAVTNPLPVVVRIVSALWDYNGSLELFQPLLSPDTASPDLGWTRVCESNQGHFTTGVRACRLDWGGAENYDGKLN